MKSYIVSASMLSLATVAILGVSGCGGSSSSNEQTSTQLTPITASGKAVDGYLVYSTVCLDLSKDGYCQLGEEPAASTDVNGSYTLTISTEQQEHENFSTAPLLVYGGYDSDTNADFTGKLKATFNKDTTANITPLTTMVEAMVAKGKDKAEAESAVKNMLGLESSADLGADPVEKAKNDDSSLLKAALQLQKSVEILTAALEKSANDKNKTVKVNDLVEGLYASLADKLKTNTNSSLENALSAVVNSDTDLDEKAKVSATTVITQIEEYIVAGKDGTVLGTTIGAMQKKIFDEVIDSDTTYYDGMFNGILEGLDDFKLLHAYEILEIIDYTGDDYEAMALKVKAVFVAAKMPDDAFLPIETEITALKANADTQAIGTAFEEKMNGFKDDADGAELLVNMESMPFSVPMSMYNFGDSEQGETLEYSVHSILEDGVFEESKMDYNESSEKFELVDNDEYSGFNLVNGEWVEDSYNSYTLSPDKTEFTVGGTIVKIAKKVDLANPTDDAQMIIDEIKAKAGDVTFPNGSEAYMLAFKQSEGYFLRKRAQTHGNMGSEYGDYYKTLEDFIKGQSGGHWFMGDSDDGGLSFEKALDDEVTLKGGDSGNLIAVNDRGESQGVAGEWRVITLPDTNTLAILAQDFNGEEKQLITYKEDDVYVGGYEDAQDSEWRVNSDDLEFNQIAFDALLETIMSQNNSDSSTQESE